MITIKSFLASAAFAATTLGFAAFSTPASACGLCSGIKLNGPVLNGPQLQGPTVQGPMIQGSATNGTQTGHIVSVSLANGVIVPVH